MSIPNYVTGDQEFSLLMDTVQSGPIVDFTISGQPYSKANSRKMAIRKSKRGKQFLAPIKNDTVQAYCQAFKVQCPRMFPCIEGDLAAVIHIVYASRRPDLDESLILDLMQTSLINNDRQIKARIVTHGVDPDNPHCRVRLYRLPT